jgi:Peptidase MA superfamily
MSLFILFMISAGFADERRILETPNLIVVYDAGLEPTGQLAAAEYPIVKQELETLFQWSLDFRPTLVLLKDHRRFQNMAGHNLVVAYALPNKNVMVIDHSSMNTSPFRLRKTLKHELCHLLMHHYIRDDNLPRWLDEGICQWAGDGFADIIMDTKRDLLSAAILSDTYFDLKKLQHQFPQDNNALMLAYEQSESVVDYLSTEYGSQGILDFLKLLRQGVDLTSAFELRFAIPFDEFQYQWRKHLKQNINWFTYLSVHLYEILFAAAALLTILGFVRKMVQRRAYSAEEDEENVS